MGHSRNSSPGVIMSLCLGQRMAQSASLDSAMGSGFSVEGHLLSPVYCAGLDLAPLVKKPIVPNSGRRIVDIYFIW